MEAEMVPSLSPLLQGADEWGEVLLLLPLLISLEAVLSADNAIALAAISRRLHDPARQRQALNLGLLLALVLRMALILAARWVLDAWPLQLAAAAYLLWLCGRHLLGLDDGQDEVDGADEVEATGGRPQGGLSLAADVDSAVSGGSVPGAIPSGPTGRAGGRSQPSPDRSAASSENDVQRGPAGRHGRGGPTLASIALTLALTDLAFSLDSVAAAVAVTDRLALVMLGGLLGVLALRLTAGLFVRWLEVFSRLETAGYLAVGLVGIRLLLRLLFPDLEVPDWVLLLSITALFLWGFSQRVPVAEGPAAPLPEPAPVPPAALAPDEDEDAAGSEEVPPAAVEVSVLAVPAPSPQDPSSSDSRQP